MPDKPEVCPSTCPKCGARQEPGLYRPNCMTWACISDFGITTDGEFTQSLTCKLRCAEAQIAVLTKEREKSERDERRTHKVFDVLQVPECKMSSGSNLRLLDRSVCVAQRLTTAESQRDAALAKLAKVEDALKLTERELGESRHKIGAAVKGASARAGGWPKDAGHGYVGENATAWLYGWQWCNDCLLDPDFVQPLNPPTAEKA